MEEYLQVGVITSTHGLKGEVKVHPLTDDPERFEDLEAVFLDAGRERIRLEIQTVRYYKAGLILKFRGIDDINDIEKYRGCSLLISREDAVDLEEDEYFIADLIGMKVVTEEDSVLGILSDVIETGANDVYVVKMDGEKEKPREILLPAIHDCILDVDVEHRVMKVHLMPGLI